MLQFPSGLKIVTPSRATLESFGAAFMGLTQYRIFRRYHPGIVNLTESGLNSSFGRGLIELSCCEVARSWPLIRVLHSLTIFDDFHHQYNIKGQISTFPAIIGIACLSFGPPCICTSFSRSLDILFRFAIEFYFDLSRSKIFLSPVEPRRIF